MHKSILLFLAVSSFPILAFANDSRTRDIIPDDAENDGAPESFFMSKFDKPIIVEFYNTGGYTANFEVNWVDSGTGEQKRSYFTNTPSGSYRRAEVPTSAVPSTIRAQGSTNTGILWDPRRKIFDEPVNNVYSSRSRYSLGYKVWGSTFSPRWANYKPNLEIEGMDPYSDDPYYCTRLTISNDPYNDLANPIRNQYEAWNVCQYGVVFVLTGASGEKRITVGSNKKEYVYNGEYNKYYALRAD